MAVKNAQHDIDTVLFFDEANTTEALGMIKEIMVDGRCNGRLLESRLKFIVACNPYQRYVRFVGQFLFQSELRDNLISLYFERCFLGLVILLIAISLGPQYNYVLTLLVS